MNIECIYIHEKRSLTSFIQEWMMMIWGWNMIWMCFRTGTGFWWRPVKVFLRTTACVWIFLIWICEKPRANVISTRGICKARNEVNNVLESHGFWKETQSHKRTEKTSVPEPREREREGLLHSAVASCIMRVSVLVSVSVDCSLSPAVDSPH